MFHVEQCIYRETNERLHFQTLLKALKIMKWAIPLLDEFTNWASRNHFPNLIIQKLIEIELPNFVEIVVQRTLLSKPLYFSEYKIKYIFKRKKTVIPLPHSIY